MKKKKILFFVAHPELDAGSRYRVYQFRPYLERAGYECVIAPFSSPILFQLLRTKGQLPRKIYEMLICTLRRTVQISAASKYEVVVINREVFPFLMPLWERAVLRRNRRVVFGFDDAVYSNHPDVSSFRHPLLYRFKYGRGVDEVMKRSACIIAGNRILGEYARRFNENVTVIPTVVDCEYYRYRDVDPDEEGVRPVVVGWMGSPSTAPYLSMVESALTRLSEKYSGRVQYRFFGCPEYQPQLPESLSLPFVLSSEIKDLHSLDIGIMPMPDTEWTRGKCAFKAIQYMATGAVAVASPVGVTTDLIRDGENGLLAQTPDEWFAALSRLVSDTQLRRSISRRARQTIIEGYSLQKWGPIYTELLTGLAADTQACAGTEVLLGA
ncbi:MAG TPA: glycosyltransferase family 4 protein [Candidatus Angelobacter sp.]|nr:glycosyltransferase family 4 protein [Candidatus Angelobacter sp.]